MRDRKAREREQVREGKKRKKKEEEKKKKRTKKRLKTKKLDRQLNELIKTTVDYNTNVCKF